MALKEDKGAHPARQAFGQRVRQLRTARALSQESLAELAGIHRTYVSGIEHGERNVGIDNIERLAAALEIPLAELFQEGPK
jgi:transcriptional regulator with XRE-family HTH domain